MTHPKTNLAVILSCLMAASLLLQESASANSVSYTISVTIPAIVGVNVHPLPTMGDTALAELTNHFWDVSLEETWRGGEKLLMQSVTEK